MSWIFLAVIGMLIWSANAVVDRFALARRIESQIFYILPAALIQFPLVLLLLPIFRPESTESHIVALSIAAGLIETAGLYYLFTAINREEISRVFPLGSISALLTLLFGWLLLGEVLAQNEFWAFGLMFIGGLFLVLKYDTSVSTYIVSRALIPMLIGAFLGTAKILVLRYVFVSTDFQTGFFYSRAGLFIGGCIVLLLYYKEIAAQWNAIQNKLRAIVIINQCVAFSGHVFFFSAVALANAALVQMVLGLQGFVVLLIASLVAYMHPNLVEESIAPRDLVQKLIGVALIVGGLYIASL